MNNHVIFFIFFHIFYWVILMEKIVICGSKGKCGSSVYQLLKDKGYDIIGNVNENETSLEEIIQTKPHIDYVIDFTNKNAALYHIELCLQHHIPFICGTTGFSQFELENIKIKCQEAKVKGIICSNFSLPMNWLIQNFNSLSSFFDHCYIEEGHHFSKLDKPSGTAKILKAHTKCPVTLKSLDRLDDIIQYRIHFESKYDKMEMVYEVYQKTVYAYGVYYYLTHPNEKVFKNLIAE